MTQRWRIYFKEMYPFIERLFLGFLLFFEIYFLVILTNLDSAVDLSIGMGEITGSITIFAFLLCLRIADDFKDFETDSRLFPERALPSGRVLKKDLAILASIVIVITVILNLVFMNNLLFFLVLVAYGFLMAFWFFQKHKIQTNLVLALITHNPVQIIMNMYVISYACIKFNIPLYTFNNLVIAFTLYFPGLIWEVSRKIRAPKDETDYVTYSKLFGYKKPVIFIMVVMFFDLISTSYLQYQLFPWSIIIVLILYLWLCFNCIRFIKDPSRFNLREKFEQYEYVAEVSVIVFIVAYLALVWFK